MTDLARLAKRPAPYYTTAQASSYDRHSTPQTKHDDAAWFANSDFGFFLSQAVSPNGVRKEYIMADLRGPGAIVRLWSANPSGTLRFYFDNEKTPRLAGTMAYLLGGRIAPLTFPFSYVAARGANMYFPLPYKERCIVTLEYEGGEEDKASGLYYHVGYRTYAANTPVRTFALSDLSDTKTLAVMETVRKDLMRPAPISGAANSKQTVLKKGQSLSLPIDAPSVNGAALRELRVQLPPPAKLSANTPWEDPHQLHNVLRNLMVSLSFDGQETVRVPLGDFFASGVGLNPNEKSYPMTIHPNGTLICRFVMPFKKRAVVKIENRNAPTQAITVSAKAMTFVFDANTYLFHAQWTAEKTPTRPFHDMNFLDAKGEGRFVGVSLAVANPTPDWWGEGDEKVTRDGEAFPSIFGTGSEDYFGYAWSSPFLFAVPYHAQTRCDGPGTAGHVSNQRWQLFDDLPFEKSLRFDMEEWHWTPNISPTFARTAYWYEKPSATGTRPAPLNIALLLPPHITPPAPVAGALEGENLPLVSVTGGKVEIQGGYWEISNSKQRWWRDAKRGNKLTLGFSVPTDGTYKLSGNFCFAVDYGIHKIRVNGQAAVPSPADFFAPNLHWEKRAVGTFALKAGQATFEVENVGKNGRAIPGQMFGLDYLLLEKIGPLPPARVPAVPTVPTSPTPSKP